MDTPIPTATNTAIRHSSARRSSPTRPPSQKIPGVNAAHNQDSMKAITIGLAGDIPRKPNPRGSSRRLAAERMARNVQKAKMASSSGGLSRGGES